ncbi:hypothetical protein [Catenulispora rubra]|uniref:hypothetical protein n=1 Tax=Catenulispora rubra TaxID=280293 RepID=UPI0018928538|nr:hypothetical protein [Catenulispora rubra]
MNRLNSIALLAGGALVAVAATGCSSSAAKPAASGPAATSSSATSGAPSTVATPAPGGASSSAAAGGTTSTPAAAPSSAGDNSGNGGNNGGGPTTAPAAAPVSHPACANATVNVSLAPAVSGQKSSVFVIAVKNTGATCTLGPIPYVWITKSPTDASDETRPLIPGVDTGKKNVILSGTTLYAAIDLLPGALATTTGNYGDLAVTANPTPDTSGKDVQDVPLPASSAEGGAKLSVYALSPASAIDQIQYATTPEK